MLAPAPLDAGDLRVGVVVVPGGDAGALRAACVSRAAATEYVLLVGDDVVDVLRLRPELLLAEAVRARYDVIGAGGPPGVAAPPPPRSAPALAAWAQRSGVFDYRGGGVELRGGAFHAGDGECRSVDFLPVAHLARRAALVSSPWDPELRGGGYVDWLLRTHGVLSLAVCEFSALRRVEAAIGGGDAAAAAAHEADLRDAADVGLVMFKRRLAHMALGVARFDMTPAAEAAMEARGVRRD